MSMKRRSDKELTHENWNDEDEAEEQGEFSKASEEELKKRKILQPKRKLDPAAATAPANPFGAISLTAATVPTLTPASTDSHTENGSSKGVEKKESSVDKGADDKPAEEDTAKEEDQKVEDSDSESGDEDIADSDDEDLDSSSSSNVAEEPAADGAVNNLGHSDSDEEEDIDSEEDLDEEEEDSESEENASDGDE